MIKCLLEHQLGIYLVCLITILYFFLIPSDHDYNRFEIFIAKIVAPLTIFMITTMILSILYHPGVS